MTHQHRIKYLPGMGAMIRLFFEQFNYSVAVSKSNSQDCIQYFKKWFGVESHRKTNHIPTAVEDLIDLLLGVIASLKTYFSK